MIQSLYNVKTVMIGQSALVAVYMDGVKYMKNSQKHIMNVSNMRPFEAKYWRGNPQLKDGGYETTRIIMANSLCEAYEKAETPNVAFGTMELIDVVDLTSKADS